MSYVWRDVVRDYELDYQGIVNNSNYLRYMEHARHQHLLALGIDFAALHESGIDLVLVKSEIDFKAPLRSNDAYQVTSDIVAVGRIRFKITQQVLRVGDNVLAAQGTHFCVAVRARDGRPICCPELLTKVEIEQR